MKFRKKPVEIEAIQWFKMGDHHAVMPGWSLMEGGKKEYFYFINTLEGEMRVKYGDWIIQGVMGEFYPCKDEIFKMTYEPVEGEA